MCQVTHLHKSRGLLGTSVTTDPGLYVGLTVNNGRCYSPIGQEESTWYFIQDVFYLRVRSLNFLVSCSNLFYLVSF